MAGDSFKESTRDELVRAAESANQSLNLYAEHGFQHILTNKRIRAHLAKYPPIKDGDKVLASLLKDREESL